MKTNCWEVKKCGRQPGGERCTEMGVCPAATAAKLHGVNNGINGGRACWVIQKTLCGDKIQGGFAEKLGNCLACDFFQKVRSEEGGGFMPSKDILAKMYSTSSARQS